MNRVYVITGATSGIGKALVKELATDNIVYAGYRSENKVSELSLISENVKPFYVDYAKPETVSEAINFIKTSCNKIDCLINVAGCVVAGPIEKIPVSEIRRQFDVNVFGHLEMAQGLAEILENGKIINVSSMASYGVFPYISPYCASKRCLDMFFNSFLNENKRNIKVVSIKPGVISTPLWDKSVKENAGSLTNCEGYEKEMEFMIANAKRNEEKGLSVEEVVKTILIADNADNPKLTYTVGKDAFSARIFSKLPQFLINKLIKLGLKIRINKQN